MDDEGHIYFSEEPKPEDVERLKQAMAEERDAVMSRIRHLATSMREASELAQDERAMLDGEEPF